MDVLLVTIIITQQSTFVPMVPVQMSKKKKLQILGQSLVHKPIKGVKLAGIKQLVDQLCSPTVVPADGVKLMIQMGVELWD